LCRYHYAPYDDDGAVDAGFASAQNFTPTQAVRSIKHDSVTYTRIHQKILPFNMLLSLPQSIMNNNDDLHFRIEWRNNSITKGIEKIINTTPTPDVVGTGRILVTSVELICDAYLPTLIEEGSLVQEKANLKPEIWGYTDLEISSQSITKGTDSEINLGIVKNLQMVMVFKSMYNTTNGGTAHTNIVYQSPTQFSLLGGQISYAASTVLKYSNEISALNHCITTIQMQYGDDIIYPSRPITLKDGNCPIFLELYYEYCKALNMFNNRTVKPMPYTVFNSTMPIILFKPFSNNGVHLCQEGKQLTLKISSPESVSDITVICFTHKNKFISADGSVTSYQ
jgi:hypothetical protein